MTDLSSVLPHLSTVPYSHLLPSLDKNYITTTDLLTLDAVDVAKRANLPPAEVTKLTRAILDALHVDLNPQNAPQNVWTKGINGASQSISGEDRRRRDWGPVSTLDRSIDAALGGGIPTGYITEITGESGVGKTQLLLTTLLSVQLPPPQGLSKSAIYISTEAALATSRLHQLLRLHPTLSELPADTKPSLSRVLSIQVPDLESQDHILRYQLPVAIARQNFGLVVIDSIAANYRAEFEKPTAATAAGSEMSGPAKRTAAKSMAERRSQLIQLGAHLRDVARTYGVAIIVANQVADRFSPEAMTADAVVWKSNNAPPLITPDPLALDHQQRWFTGWGDLRGHADNLNLKTPSLGLVWANQIAARIALVKDSNVVGDGRRRRWLRVVFAAWCGPTAGRGVEFEIMAGGLRAVGEGRGDDVVESGTGG